MSYLEDWDDPMSSITILGIIFGFTFLVVLVVKMPLAAAAVIGIGLAAVLWWVFNRSTTADVDVERDPLTVLKERYARGDISEEAFEHQVTTLLDVDEIADRKYEFETEEN